LKNKKEEKAQENIIDYGYIIDNKKSGKKYKEDNLRIGESALSPKFKNAEPRKEVPDINDLFQSLDMLSPIEDDPLSPIIARSNSLFDQSELVKDLYRSLSEDTRDMI